MAVDQRMIRAVGQSMTSATSGWSAPDVTRSCAVGEERVALPEVDVFVMTNPPIVDIQDNILKIS